MALEDYKRKRDFTKTPEPPPEIKKKTKGDELFFCVQKHLASHLHYDLRLEWNGVLLSWAVPKGPSIDPRDKRLAMQTEDHPFDYGMFEGVIPEGYGAGIVMLWDYGTWQSETEGVDAGLRKGELKFRLNGFKLKGSWVLIKTRYGGAPNSWLLIKHKDEWAGPLDITEFAPLSVKTPDADFAEILSGKTPALWHSNAPAKGGDGDDRGHRRGRLQQPAAAVPRHDVARGTLRHTRRHLTRHRNRSSKQQHRDDVNDQQPHQHDRRHGVQRDPELQDPLQAVLDVELDLFTDDRLQVRQLSAILVRQVGRHLAEGREPAFALGAEVHQVAPRRRQRAEPRADVGEVEALQQIGRPGEQRVGLGLQPRGERRDPLVDRLHAEVGGELRGNRLLQVHAGESRQRGPEREEQQPPAEEPGRQAEPDVNQHVQARDAAAVDVELQPALRRAERLGVASRERPAGPLVWMHAASVGETNAVLPLFDAMRARRPELGLLLTTGTVTSAALAAQRLRPVDIHQYVPIDTPDYAARFLDHWRPDLAVFTESEIWPNLILAIAEKAVPLALVNARMSKRSYGRWSRLSGISRPLFTRLDLVLAQNEKIGRWFTSLGCRRVEPVGNLKIDAPPPPRDDIAHARLKQALGERAVLVAASTHDGEEALLAAAHRQIAAHHAGLCTIIAPRHPERGPAIAATLQAAGLSATLRSTGALPEPATDVYIADTIGELGTLFSIGPVAFLGKSLVAGGGGQNPIEAIRLGAIVLSGPHWDNFKDAYTALQRHGGVVQVQSPDDIAATVLRLLADPAEAQRIRRGADGALASLSGALERSVALLLPMLPPEEGVRRAS